MGALLSRGAKGNSHWCLLPSLPQPCLLPPYNRLTPTLAGQQRGYVLCSLLANPDPNPTLTSRQAASGGIYTGGGVEPQLQRQCACGDNESTPSSSGGASRSPPCLPSLAYPYVMH
jgi:hypothetical protein